MYAAAVRGIELLGEYDLSQYTPAIILLTDGQSSGSCPILRRLTPGLETEVPVFSIMFGDADETQLEELARYYQCPGVRRPGESDGGVPQRKGV